MPHPCSSQTVSLWAIPIHPPEKFPDLENKEIPHLHLNFM